jgi:uncharacterized protein involved in exopolysaccharide biosynthesis
MDPKVLPPGPIIVAAPERQLLRHCLTVLFKWKWVIIGIFLAVVVPVVAMSQTKAPVYQATSKVLIKQDRTYLAVGAGTDERVLSVPLSRQTINSEIQIVKSLDVLERVVRDLGLHSAANWETESPSEIRGVALNLQGAVNVTAVPDSNIIQVAVTHPSADLVKKLANEISESYQEKHAAIYRSRAAAAFFTKQATVYDAERRKAEERLQSFEVREGPEPDKQIQEALAAYERIDRARRDVDVELAEAEQQLAVFTAELENQPQWITGDTDMILNRSVEVLQARLLQLELEKKALLQLYTPKDRRVVGKQEEIDQVQAKLAGESAYVLGRETTARNHTRAALEQSLTTARARRQALQAKQAILSEQLAQAGQVLKQLPQRSFAHWNLKQAVKNARDNRELYLKKGEEARISEAMDKEGLINVAIVERAASASAIQNKLVLPMAAMAGLALSVGGVFVAEVFNPTLKNERDVEERLGLPVLASIDHFGGRRV